MEEDEVIDEGVATEEECSVTEFSGKAEHLKDLLDQLCELAVEHGIDNAGCYYLSSGSIPKEPTIKLPKEMEEIIDEIDTCIAELFVGTDGAIDGDTIALWNNMYEDNEIILSDVEASLYTESIKLIFGDF